MPSPTVAIACCRRTYNAPPDDLYPDPDAAPLQDALASMGVGSTLVAWDDPGAEWASLSSVLVSSTWDSVDRPVGYLAWVRRVGAATMLANPAAVIEWGLDKVHQRELAGAGVPVVLQHGCPGSSWASLPEADFVVKPSVSAGGRGTAIYAGGDPAALVHVRALQALGQTVMVQDYLPSVEGPGDVDLVFFDGAFSQAVVKKPFLRKGEGVIERPWERMSWAGLTSPSLAQVALADRTDQFVSEPLGCRLTFARVDLMEGHRGGPLLLEVELVDPYLSLDIEPAAAGRLAGALMTLPGNAEPGGPSFPSSIERWRARSATGTVLAAMALGLQVLGEGQPPGPPVGGRPNEARRGRGTTTIQVLGLGGRGSLVVRSPAQALGEPRLARSKSRGVHINPPRFPRSVMAEPWLKKSPRITVALYARPGHPGRGGAAR